ncbi:MAG: hypothetical protein V3V81_07995 [Candidatus Bathyarchaeia archaeon]
MRRKKEEQIIGWDVKICFGSSIWTQTIEVDTWDEAVKIAENLAVGLHPTFKEEKEAIFVSDKENIVYAKVSPITRTIYVKG